MGFSLIIIGMLFLLGPDIALIDILPDFIGYILILKGISMISKINSDFDAGAKYFKWCLVTSLVKIPFYMMALSMMSDDQFMTLLFLFVGGLFDAYFAYNAFNSFFDGLSSSTPSNASDPNYKCAVFNNFEKIRKFTLVFVILKPVLYIAPELTKIDNNEFGEVTTNGIATLYRFYNIFVALSAFIALVVGIVWYVKIRKYLKGVLADSFYINSLEEKYKREFSDNNEKSQSFYLLRVFTFLTVAFVFLLKFQLDGINFIPPFLFPLFVCICSLYMKDTDKEILKKIKLLSLVNVGVSLIYWIYNIVFVKSFMIVDNTDYGMTLSYAEQLDMMINSDFDTLYGFIGLCVISFISSVLEIILVKLLFDRLLYIAKTHSFTHFDEKHDVLSTPSDIFENEQNNSNLKLFKASRAFCYIVVAFEFISTALTTLYPELVSKLIRSIPDYPQFFRYLRSILTNVMPSLWTIDFVLRIIFVVLISVLITRMRDAYKTRNYIE